MGESYGEHYWKNENSGYRHNRDWEQGSGRWQKCDQPPYENRGGNWHSNNRPRAPNTLRLQSQGSLIRSSSSGGQGDAVYDSYWGSDYENHSGRMFYTKRQLLMIYDQLKTRRQLVVPFDCDLPVTLHREGVMMGYQEFAEDKWLCADPAGRVQGPVSKQEILTGKASGALSGDLGVVPLSWFREKSVTVNQLIQMWHENDATLKENMEKQVSKNGVEETSTAEQDQPTTNSTAQSCTSTTTTAVPSCRFDRVNVLSPKLDTDNFMYIDSYGAVQGPFKKQQLLEWWKQGYLPQGLHVYPMGCEKSDCIKFRSILAKWCCDAGDWKYLPFGGNVEGPFPKSRILEWFENGLLPLNLAVRPGDWEDSVSTWFQLPEVLVCWLPQSTRWHCQKKGSQDDQVITVEEVAGLWESEHNHENGSLLVLPDSWKGKVYFPVEVLMKAYGYLV
ncbi:hypothetical protein BSKO_11482 [Bryopsis sp. KO-2023]|nr:hypothetical protein BSKO_11482 [Bryopsis sp. KO-2023]